MKIVIQRVKEASISIDNNIVASIGCGIALLIGFHKNDEAANFTRICNKIDPSDI